MVKVESTEIDDDGVIAFGRTHTHQMEIQWARKRNGIKL